MMEAASFIVALGFLALIGLEAERVLNGSAGLRERLARGERQPVRVPVRRN